MLTQGKVFHTINLKSRTRAIIPDEAVAKKNGGIQRALLYMLLILIVLCTGLLSFNLWFHSVKLRITTRSRMVLSKRDAVERNDPKGNISFPWSKNFALSTLYPMLRSPFTKDFGHLYEGKQQSGNLIRPSWFSSGVKYFVYQPSGGISNQRKILEWAVMVSYLLNRTLIIPPMAPHTTLYKNYNKQTYNTLSPADEVMDVNLMNSFVDTVIVKGQTLHDFMQQLLFLANNLSWSVLVRNNLREKRANRWSSSQILQYYGTDKSDILYFKEGTMWQCFDFTKAEIRIVQKHVRFHPKLRHAARQLSRNINSGLFNALHIRFADGDTSKLREGWLKPPRSFLSRMQLAKFSEITPYLYIATVPKKRNSTFFSQMRAKYNVVFSSDLNQNILSDVLSAYPMKLQPSILGAIEQLICARAQKFLGTGFSTFSEYIRNVRENRILGNDPLLDKNLSNPIELEVESRFLNTVSKCTSEVKVC